MLVRRMGMIGTERVHGVFDVRQLSRGEIRSPSAARGVPVGKKGTTVSQLFSWSANVRGGASRNVHSNGVLVGRTFVLFHFEDAPLDGRTHVEVTYASAPGALYGVAGSGARLGIGASNIAEPAAARGMLKKIKKINDPDNSLEEH